MKYRAFAFLLAVTISMLLATIGTETASVLEHACPHLPSGGGETVEGFIEKVDNSCTVTNNSYITVAFLTLSTDASGQNLRERARERARTEPNGTVNIAPSPAHYRTTSIEELTKGSIVVLTGRLVRRGSFLTTNDSFVRTDYDIEEAAILRGRLPVPNGSVPGLAMPLTVARWGGEVVVEGVRIRAVNESFEPIKEGVPYLLFLTPSRSPDIRGYYVAYGEAGIFEIVSQQLKPLLKQGDEVFAWAAETPLSEVIRRIQAAGQVQ